MALLHVRRTLADDCSSDIVVAADELNVNGDDSSPVHSLEVIGVRGRVQEMVLRFSLTSNGLYNRALAAFCRSTVVLRLHLCFYAQADVNMT